MVELVSANRTKPPANAELCLLYIVQRFTLNLNGYYDPLKELLYLMIEMGLSSKARQQGIFFAKDLSQIRQILGE